jgi:murein DD-endopeptidase MepM/ murein hydrolase activator NlpD
MIFQPLHSWLHRKNVRRVLITISAALLVLLVLTFAAGTERISNKLMFYARVARLYTKDADRRLAMPLKQVRKEQITDTWHAPRGSNRLHEGQDIFAPKGTPIYSATSGYVYNIGENNLGGHTVSIIGAGGVVYYYAHLDSYAPNLSEGDPVTTRTVLGFVGTTGNASGTPPHLHFGVYSTSGAVNPLPLLTDRPTQVVTKSKPDAPRKRPTRTN